MTSKDKERRPSFKNSKRNNKKFPYKKNRKKPIMDLKLSTIFLVFLFIFFLDFSSTIIALNFCTGLVEANPIHNYFFSWGWFGWIVSFLVSSLLIFILATITFYGKNYIKEKEEEYDEKLGFSLLFTGFIFGVIYCLELMVIFNNISLIIAS